jgi:hypothetical protein
VRQPPVVVEPKSVLQAQKYVVCAYVLACLRERVQDSSNS